MGLIPDSLRHKDTAFSCVRPLHFQQSNEKLDLVIAKTPSRSFSDSCITAVALFSHHPLRED